MTENATGNPEAEIKLKSSFLIIYSKEDSGDFASDVIAELRDYGFQITDINDQIDQGSWSAQSEDLMNKTPAILIIPSQKLNEDGEIKTAMYRANVLRVEGGKTVVPILNSTNAKQGPRMIRSLAGVNWDGATTEEFSVRKEDAFKQLQKSLEENLAK